VQDHVNQARSGTTYNTYLPNAKGVIVGEQHKARRFQESRTPGHGNPYTSPE
jgi:hypothetical protein